MPLVRIDLVQGKSAEYRRAIGGVVYEAMVDVLKAPTDDRFQVIAEYPADALIADENYLGIRRTQDCVIIQLAIVARIATIPNSSIILIDLLTEEGVVTRSYLEPYTAKAMRYLIPCFTILGTCSKAVA
jgi:phenylpyruvate tautomerase PptA (4-oxalocrotonate tautomerase family)